MKYIYLILLIIIIILSCGCIDDSEYEIREEHRKFIIELKEEYDKENISKPYNEIRVQAVQRYDNEKPFEGNEFTYLNSQGYATTSRSITLKRVSGSDFNTPFDITAIFNGDDWDSCYCVPLKHTIDKNGDRWIDSGWCGRYKIYFNVIRYDRITENDIIYVILDDLDNYLGKDIMHSTKADPVHIATIIGG